MKRTSIAKQTTLLAVILSMVLLWGCDKRDSAASFGFAYIDIPQSNVSGGVNLDYLVPSGLDSATHNYQIDKPNNKFNVFLGVSRSGSVPNNPYTVNINVRTDTIATLIASGALSMNPNPTHPVVILPASAYTLPTSVSVPSGQYMASFNLSINETTLKSYAGQKVALCVYLSSPTAFAISPTNSKVIILIDVDSLNLP